VAGVLRLAKGNVLVLKDRGIQNVKRILVPIGGGPHARLGLTLAHELAGQWAASITALKVQIGKGVTEDSTDFQRQSIELFKTHAEDFGKDLLQKNGVPAQVKVKIGTDVAKTIIAVSEEHDLIVIGASEERSLKQRLFGSIPDHVADHAPVSVLMVRASH
jgi:nucleotide-binding universal stress UspA family protein